MTPQPSTRLTAPALALAWEIWRKNRTGNFALLAGIPACLLLALPFVRRMPSWQDEAGQHEGLWTVLLFPLVASFIWVFGIFAHTEGDAKRGFSGIPARLFSLPVRTSFLVGCLMLYGVASVVAVYLAWVGGVFWPLGVSIPVRWPLLVLVTGMVCFQAAVWVLASFPWIRMVTIAAGAFGLIAALSVPYADRPPAWASERAFTVVLLAALPLAYLGAVCGVNAERRGGWQAWAWLRPTLRKVADALPRWRGPFASPAQAQFWFEWRRKGWFLSGGLALAITGTVCVLPVAAILDTVTPLPVLAIVTMLTYPLMLAAIGGTSLAKTDFWSPESAIQSFHAVRPLSTDELVRAKMKVATAATLLGCLAAAPLVWAVTAGGWWLEVWRMAGLPARLGGWLPGDARGALTLGVIAVVAFMAATWRVMITSLGLGLTGQRRTIIRRSILHAALFVGTIIVVSWLYRHPAQLNRVEPLAYALAGCLALWKTGQTFRSFAAVRRAGLMEAKQRRCLMLIWIALAGCLTAFAAALWTSTPTPRLFILIFTALLWPAGELPQCTANLVANRHR